MEVAPASTEGANPFQKLPSTEKTHDYVEANGSRSNSIWMLVEVAGKLDRRLCGSYTTSVEVGGSKGK